MENKLKHLRFDFYAAYKAGMNERAERIMLELGITYQYVTAHAIADQVWFWNCENIPDELPKYLTVLEADPWKYVGAGLTRLQAENIRLRAELYGGKAKN